MLLFMLFQAGTERAFGRNTIPDKGLWQRSECMYLYDFLCVVNVHLCVLCVLTSSSINVVCALSSLSSFSLCCECGLSIEANAANMCIDCLKTRVDITQGISNSLVLNQCRGCDR
jgi:hypothetical protein